MRENYYERSVGFASDEIKFIPSYAEHISYTKRISYCVAIFHSFRQERISLKKARPSVRMRRRRFTMRSVASRTEGALHFSCTEGALHCSCTEGALHCSCTEGALHFSCTEGAFHVPQGTLSFKTGGVSNYERSVGFASVQSLGAFIIRHPCLTRLCGFSHPTAHKKRRRHPLGVVFAFWCRWRGSNPHGIATNGF